MAAVKCNQCQYGTVDLALPHPPCQCILLTEYVGFVM